MQCVPSEPSEGLVRSNMAYYAEAAVSSHESTGSVCVFMSQHVYFGVCPPFVDSFVCMRVYNHGKVRVCVRVSVLSANLHSLTRSSSGAEGSSVTGGWMKYLAVACFKKNNRCFVLLICTLARGESGPRFLFLFFFLLQRRRGSSFHSAELKGGGGRWISPLRCREEVGCTHCPRLVHGIVIVSVHDRGSQAFPPNGPRNTLASGWEPLSKPSQRCKICKRNINLSNVFFLLLFVIQKLLHLLKIRTLSTNIFITIFLYGCKARMLPHIFLC